MLATEKSLGHRVTGAQLFGQKHNSVLKRVLPLACNEKKKTILGCTTCKACQRKQVDDTSKGIDHMYSLLQILKTATSTLKEKQTI